MGISSSWKDTLKVDKSRMLGEDAERAAKKEQVIQSSKLRAQEEKEKLRLLEAEDEISRRKVMARLGGRQSLISGQTPTGSLLG